MSDPPSGRDTAVIIDHQQYAQAVILRSQPIPWADPTAYSQFLGQAQGLLKPDTTLLDLGAFYEHALATNEALNSSLSARSRTGYALKTLLADGATAGAALELASVVSQTSRAPLVLQIPSPMRWLARTHQLSGAGTVTDLNVHHAENAAIYIADWLRRLSKLPVSMLLLDERWTGSGELPLVDSSAYAPLQRHRQLPVGARAAHARRRACPRICGQSNCGAAGLLALRRGERNLGGLSLRRDPR